MTAFVQMCMGLLKLTKETGEWRLLFNYKNMKKIKRLYKSIISTSKKIARIVFVMLSKREEFNPFLMVNALENRLTLDEV